MSVRYYEFDAGYETSNAPTSEDLTGRYREVTISHTELQTASTTNSIEAFSLPAKRVLCAIVVKHTTAFEGTGITDYKVSIGISGDTSKFILDFDVDQTVGDSAFVMSAFEFLGSFANDTSIQITATSTGANLDQSSAGSLKVYYRTTAIP